MTDDLPTGYKMTELGPLPQEWRVVRLGEVVEKTKQIDPRKKPEWFFKYVDVSLSFRGNVCSTHIWGNRVYLPPHLVV